MMPDRLTARRALVALRALGCDHRADVDAVGSAWIATCPACRRPGALRVREIRERDDEHPEPAITVGCSERCTPPQELIELLARDPEVLELTASRARWRGLAYFLVDTLSLQLALGAEHDRLDAHHDDERQLAA